jgi:xanthine dehydrogenase YagS FAD-binding subunit
MRPFSHYNAESIDQAMALVAAHSGDTDFIAGGTDLLGVLKDEILEHAPAALINLKTIPGLDAIETGEDDITLGALAKLTEVAKNADIRQHYPLLSTAACSVATPEIRNMGTIGGNLCQETRCWYYRYPHAMGGRIQCRRKGSGPCPAIKGDNRYHSIYGGKKCFAVCPSDTAVALAALDAHVDIAGPEGKYTISIGNLYDTLGTTLKKGELLLRIRIPRSETTSKQAFIKFRVRESVDFAMASVACVLDIHGGVCRQARIVLGGVAPVPWRVVDAEATLIDETITSETAAAAAMAATAKAKPLSRNEYKIALVKTLVQRAVLQAAEEK